MNKNKQSTKADLETQEHLKHLINYEEAKLIIKDASILDLK